MTRSKIHLIPGIVLMIILIILSCDRNRTVTLESLLSEMTDPAAITRFPDPAYKVLQFSSYDRETVSPESDGWFANADYSRFIRTDSVNQRREMVMFDHNGAGAIVRWWMTFAGEGASDGTIRIYFDNSPDPAIEGAVTDLISGGMLAGEPLGTTVSQETEYHQRAHNLYLPIPYGSRCIITYECDSLRYDNGSVKPSIYYNINYRAYEEGTVVKTFTMKQLRQMEETLENTNRIISEQPHLTGASDTLWFNLKPGEEAAIEIKKRDRALSSLLLTLNADDHDQALRSTVLTASFDGNQTIWVPAGDFFGTGTKISQYITHYSSTGKMGTMIFNRIMPFRKECAIRLVNHGNGIVSGLLIAGNTKYRWSSSSMYFGASWHEYHNIKAPGSELTGGSGDHSDINFVEITGKGVYAGDGVTVVNSVDAWWGEGDEKIYVDGELFPSSIGTGTEDYYGYAWCRPEVFSHPFIAQPRGDGNFHPGLTINLRHRSLDAIPFTSSIRSDIELWHWVPAIMNYALTSWYYIMPGYSVNRKPDPAMAGLKVEKNPRSMTETGK